MEEDEESLRCNGGTGQSLPMTSLSENHSKKESRASLFSSISEVVSFRDVFSKTISKSSNHTLTPIFYTQSSIGTIIDKKTRIIDLIDALHGDDETFLREQISKNEFSIDEVLFACAEEDSDTILSSLLSEVEDVIQVQEDDRGITLLHVAVAHSSVKSVHLLLDKEALVDDWDGGRQYSVMHACATNTKNGVEIMKLLIAKGGDINAGINKETGSVLQQAVVSENKDVVKYLLNQKSITRPQVADTETVLHSAVRKNNIDILNILLEHNSKLQVSLINFTNEQRETPLHLAAEKGNPDINRTLLTHKADPSARDHRDQTPFLLAAANLNFDVLNVFMKKVPVSLNKFGMGMGELVNYSDRDGRSPLSVCAASSKKGATRCLQVLLDHGAKLDDQDIKGFTPLMRAATDLKADRVNFLIMKGADLGLMNKIGLSALHLVYKNVPQCLKTFENRLSSGIDLQTVEADPKSAYPDPKAVKETIQSLKLDFKMISEQIGTDKSANVFLELAKIKDKMSKDILEHPLSQAFLYIKWNKVKYFYMVFNILPHLIFSLTFSTYVLLAFSFICQPLTGENRWNMTEIVQCTLDGSNKTNNTKAHISPENHNYYFNMLVTVWIVLMVWTFNFICKQFAMLFHRGPDYFTSYGTYVTWPIIVGVLMSSFHIDPFNKSQTISFRRWQFHAAAYACLFTWYAMLLYIGHIPKFGKYVDMFRTVARRMFLFMVTYIPLLLAFGISFMILFPQQEAFQEIVPMIIKVFVMMLGEIEYDDLYYPKNQKTGTVEYQPFPVTAHLILFLFIVTAAVILMNLLVGLAVSDIDRIRKKARIKQLHQQVELIDYIEGVMSSSVVKWLTSLTSCTLVNWLRNTSVPAVKTIRLHQKQGVKELPERIKLELNNILLSKSSEGKVKTQEEGLKEVQCQLAGTWDELCRMREEMVGVTKVLGELQRQQQVLVEAVVKEVQEKSKRVLEQAENQSDC